MVGFSWARKAQAALPKHYIAHTQDIISRNVVDEATTALNVVVLRSNNLLCVCVTFMAKTLEFRWEKTTDYNFLRMIDLV